MCVVMLDKCTCRIEAFVDKITRTRANNANFFHVESWPYDKGIAKL